MATRNGVSLNWGGFDRALETAGRRLEAHRLALMEVVGDTLLSGTHERLDAEEDPEGRKWKPSARAREEDGKTLDDSSALRDSLDYLALPDRVMVGSNLPYARIHQKGGKTSPHVIRPKRKKALAFKGMVRKKVNHPGSDIPARPYLGVSEKDMDEIRAVMADFMKNAFNRKE